MKVLSIRNNKAKCFEPEHFPPDLKIVNTIEWFPSTGHVGIQQGVFEWVVSFEVPTGYVRLI